MITVKVDTREFDKTMKEYMRYTSRTLTDAVNQHAYYTARAATRTTKAAEASQIRKDLETESKHYPGVPLAAILVNIERKKQGKRGLTGERMRVAVESFIKRMIAHRNFLRSGWIPAIKVLAAVVQKKKGERIPPGTDKKGRNYGGGRPARYSFLTWNPTAILWNSAVGKGKTSDRSLKYIEEGIQAAINTEIESMKQYIEKKHNEAVAKFWS